MSVMCDSALENEVGIQQCLAILNLILLRRINTSFSYDIMIPRLVDESGEKLLVGKIVFPY